MKKLNKSEFIDKIGQEWIYLTVGEAVSACNFMLHSFKPGGGGGDDVAAKGESEVSTWNNVV